MNTLKLSTIAGAVAAICVVATAAASHLDANSAAESSTAYTDPMSNQQLWNYAIANGEGFNTGGPSTAGADADKLARSP